jgi:hypothetical protein
MTPLEERTAEKLRHEIEQEREQLAAAVDTLRQEASKLRARLPIAAAGALGAGLVLAGGIGATMRLVFRRGRER